jgi:hypothetical protein
MSEPTYSVTTERTYDRLPEAYRTLDAQNDWQFKKYISSIVDQLGDIDVLVARIGYIPPEDRKDYYDSLNEFNTYQRPAGIEDPDLGFLPIEQTSDLFDARTADSDWLDYIGQLTGADTTRFPTPDEKRDVLINDFLGFRAGSKLAVEASVKSLLTGTKFSRVYPQRDANDGDIFSVGTQWDVLIVTRPEESPSSSIIIDKVIRDGAKPAGVVLHHLAYALVWSILETDFATWTAIEALGNWSNLELAGADNLPA